MRVLDGSQSWSGSSLENPTSFITRHSHGHCSSDFVAKASLGQQSSTDCGIGSSSVIQIASLVALSADLPVLIQVVDDEAHVDRLSPILDEMLTGGALVTLERSRSQVRCGTGIVATPPSRANDFPLSSRQPAL